MQLSAAAADHHAGHLAGEAEDRGVDTPGGGQRGAGVQHAWAGHHRIGRGTAGRARIAQRHVGGGLLVARVDQAQRIGGAREGVEQAVGLHARQAKHGVNAVAQQAVNDRFAAGHTCHGVNLVLQCPG